MANLKLDFQLPNSPIHIGSYVKVPVLIPNASKITIDDLDFVVREGAKGGKISLSRDRYYYVKVPEIMLLVGFEPGKYLLKLFKRSLAQ